MEQPYLAMGREPGMTISARRGYPIAAIEAKDFLGRFSGGLRRIGIRIEFAQAAAATGKGQG